MNFAERATQKLRERFPGVTLEEIKFRDELTLIVPREKIVEICQFLRDDPELRFNFLSDICGMDLLFRHLVDHDIPPETPRFEVVYHLYSVKHFNHLRLKVRVPENHCHVPTVTGVWSTANWHERETYDMMGITFDGHPDLRRILTAEQVYDEKVGRWKTFEGHPLRKDFSLDYEPVDFTGHITKRKLAKE